MCKRGEYPLDYSYQIQFIRGGVDTYSRTRLLANRFTTRDRGAFWQFICILGSRNESFDPSSSYFGDVIKRDKNILFFWSRHFHWCSTHNIFLEGKEDYCWCCIKKVRVRWNRPPQTIIACIMTPSSPYTHIHVVLFQCVSKVTTVTTLPQPLCSLVEVWKYDSVCKFGYGRSFCHILHAIFLMSHRLWHMFLELCCVPENRKM